MKYITIFTLLCLILSCTVTEVEFNFTKELGKLDYDYKVDGIKEDLDNDVVALGRVLFYDPILSKNGTVSCASCHIQEFSFGDNSTHSLGFLGGETFNNTPHLINASNNNVFGWSGFNTDIRNASLAPIFNPIELGISLDQLQDRINNTPYYEPLIQNAFNTDNLDNTLLGEALAQFTESLIPINSKFAQGGINSQIFTDTESKGLWLFEAYCESCHSLDLNEPPHHDGDFTADIGLPDLNLQSVPTTYYSQAFSKIPQLWNVSNTGPYMHDGRFETLEEVLEHYSSDVVTRSSTSITPLHFDKRSQDNIIAFLKTLDDASIRTDVKFSDPFLN